MIKFVKLISLVLVTCFVLSACGGLAGIGAAFDDMVKTFTNLYGNDVPMLFVFGCMANENYENATIRSKYLIKSKYIAQGYNMKIVNLTTNRLGNASHPNVEGAKIQGEELAEFIKSNYPELFK